MPVKEGGDDFLGRRGIIYSAVSLVVA